MAWGEERKVVAAIRTPPGQIEATNGGHVLNTTTMTTIALLTCGRLTGKPLAENGDYYDIYLRYMQQSSPGTTFTLHPYDVREKMAYPVHEDAYSCMLLTGSGPFHLDCLRIPISDIYNSLLCV
jgi:hypothetical protein